MGNRNMDFFQLSGGFNSVRRPSMRRRSHGSTSSRHSSTASVRSNRRGYSLPQGHTVLAMPSDGNSPLVPVINALESETASETNALAENSEQGRCPPSSSPIIRLPGAPSIPLTTLEENSLERNESTSSNNTSSTFPKYVRRQHPRSRYRHRSLPDMLPMIPGQPSLTEQLANWFPLGSRSSDCSTTEWDASSTISSPQNSIASCSMITEESEDYEPVIETANVATQHSPEPDRKIIHIRSGSASSPRLSDELFFAVDSKPRSHSESTAEHIIDASSALDSSQAQSQEASSGYRRYPSNVVRKPLPPTSVFTMNIIPPTPVSAFGRPALSSGQTLRNDSTKIVAISEDETTPPAVVMPDLIRFVQQTAASRQVVPPKRQAENSPPPVPDKRPITPPKEPTTPTTPVPPTASVALKSTVPPTDAVPQPNPAPSKPMSAQAKRRAAHQRRMELAYGSK